ncbi:MAG: ATP-binding protein [Oscillospiraceae bacterium]|nr:ATP-binding protein [Oscillospiraceae bacterium]
MVKLIAGLSGSGKTQEMLRCLNEAVEQEHGSVVCIEKGNKLRFDVNYKVRLIEYQTYELDGTDALKAFISGLHAGNFDITHIFLKSIHRLLGTDDAAEMTRFCDWCRRFGEANSVSFTMTARIDPALIPEEMKQYI